MINQRSGARTIGEGTAVDTGNEDGTMKDGHARGLGGWDVRYRRPWPVLEAQKRVCFTFREY